MNDRPLCPHCYRDACPWLVAYIWKYLDGALGAPVPADACPHYGHKVPPVVRPRLRAALDGGVEMRKVVTDSHPWRFGQ